MVLLSSNKTTYLGKIDTPTGSSYFGSSIYHSERFLFVGAEASDNDDGRVYIYNNSEGEKKLSQTLKPHTRGTQEKFGGRGIFYANGYLFIGAYSSARIYVYVLNSNGKFIFKKYITIPGLVKLHFSLTGKAADKSSDNIQLFIGGWNRSGGVVIDKVIGGEFDRENEKWTLTRTISKKRVGGWFGTKIQFVEETTSQGSSTQKVYIIESGSNVEGENIWVATLGYNNTYSLEKLSNSTLPTDLNLTTSITAFRGPLLPGIHTEHLRKREAKANNKRSPLFFYGNPTVASVPFVYFNYSGIIEKIYDPTGDTNSYFGSNIYVHGDTLYVGAVGAAASDGEVHIYQINHLHDPVDIRN